jgi:hypothetical protein
LHVAERQVGVHGPNRLLHLVEETGCADAVAPDEEVHRSARELCKAFAGRQIDRVGRGPLDSMVTNVTDDANHVEPLAVRASAQSLAQSRSRRAPLAARELFGHGCDRPRAVIVVAPLERAAGDERRAERAEEARRNVPEIERDRSCVGPVFAQERTTRTTAGGEWPHG